MAVLKLMREWSGYIVNSPRLVVCLLVALLVVDPTSRPTVALCGGAVYVFCLLLFLCLPASRAAEVIADLDKADSACKLTRCGVMTAYEFKAEFGELKYNKANRIIAGDWVRKKFKEMDMRAVDIVRHMSITVELCLVPTTEAVVAASFARDLETRKRRGLVDNPK